MQNTLLQRKRSISKTDLATGKVLQIIHIPSHWVACQLLIHKRSSLICMQCMATLAHLAFGKDSTAAVFDQDDMRSHLMCILENNTISET